MIKKFLGRLAVLVAVTASVLVTTQATAMADFSWCPDGKLCMSTGTNGNGTKWSYWVSQMNNGVEMSSNQRSQVSSFWNRTSGFAILWDTLECKNSNSDGIRFLDEDTAGNLADEGFDNKARSFGHEENRPPLNPIQCWHLNG